MEDLEAPKLIKSDNNEVTVINRTPFTIGRGFNCDYIVADNTISRQHCKFEKIENQWFLVDTSTNGTIVNDLIIKSNRSLLRVGDVIQLSKELDFTFTYTIGNSESNETGPSNSADRTELKRTLPMESSVDSGELSEKLIKITYLSPQMLTADSVIDLTAEEEEPVKKDSSSQTERSDSPQPSTSTHNDEKTEGAKENVDQDLTCTICSEMFVKATTLNCSHSFCKLCIEIWRTEHPKCPICRGLITSMNPSIVIDKIIDAFVEKSSAGFQESRKELMEDHHKAIDERKARKARHDSDSSASTHDSDQGWEDDGSNEDTDGG